MIINYKWKNHRWAAQIQSSKAFCIENFLHCRFATITPVFTPQIQSHFKFKRETFTLASLRTPWNHRATCEHSICYTFWILLIGRLGWGATAGKFLRQSLGRTVFGKESFESIPETSRSSVETCTWAIWTWEAQCSLGANLNGATWAGSCSTLSLAGKFLLLISFLTLLSTYMQSLENSI